MAGGAVSALLFALTTLFNFDFRFRGSHDIARAITSDIVPITPPPTKASDFRFYEDAFSTLFELDAQERDSNVIFSNTTVTPLPFKLVFGNKHIFDTADSIYAPEALGTSRKRVTSDSASFTFTFTEPLAASEVVETCAAATARAHYRTAIDGPEVSYNIVSPSQAHVASAPHRLYRHPVTPVRAASAHLHEGYANTAGPASTVTPPSLLSFIATSVLFLIIFLIKKFEHLDWSAKASATYAEALETHANGWAKTDKTIPLGLLRTYKTMLRDYLTQSKSNDRSAKVMATQLKWFAVQYTALTDKLSASTRQCTSVVAENKRLGKRMDLVVVYVKHLTDEVFASQKDLREDGLRYKALQDKIKLDEQQRRKKDNSASQERQKQVKELASKVADLELKNTALEDAKNNLEQKNSKLSTQLQDSKDDSAAEIARLEGLIGLKEDGIAELVKEKKALKTAMKEKSDELEAAQKKAKAAEEGFHKEQVRLETSAKKAHADKEELESQVTALYNDLNTVRDEKVGLNDRITAQRTTIRSFQTETLPIMQTQLNNQATGIKCLQNDNSDLHNKLSRAESSKKIAVAACRNRVQYCDKSTDTALPVASEQQTAIAEPGKAVDISTTANGDDGNAVIDTPSPSNGVAENASQQPSTTLTGVERAGGGATNGTTVSDALAAEKRARISEIMHKSAWATSDAPTPSQHPPTPPVSQAKTGGATNEAKNVGRQLTNGGENTYNGPKRRRGDRGNTQRGWTKK